MMRIPVFFSYLLLCNFGFSQEEVKKDTSKIEEKSASHFKVSGYIQTQFQIGEPAATLKVGGPNTNPNKNFNRIGIRRGRIKMQFEKGNVLGVFQLDATEKGVGVRDAYLKVNVPRFGTSSFQAGVFNRPFGYEVAFSSSRRETPERAMINTTLFPDERDLGLMATFQTKKSSPWYLLKLDVGLFAGNSVHLETDNRKDLMARLSFNKLFESDVKLSGGISYYYGGVYQGTENVYTVSDKVFILNSKTSNLGEFAKREYVGIDVQLGFTTIIGKTKLYGEYIQGTQPGIQFNTKSPNSSAVPTSDTYIRSMRGGYLTFVQSIGKLPVSLVTKLDWYDPNTQISRNEIGLGGSDKGDLMHQTLGLGLLWEINENLKMQAYYDFVQNEKTENLVLYKQDLNDNVLTFRIQYKF